MRSTAGEVRRRGSYWQGYCWGSSSAFTNWREQFGRHDETAAVSTMKPVAVMVVSSVATWAGTAAIVDRRTSLEVLFGMLGPLAATCGTWLLAAWFYEKRPEELTGLMAAAFFLKMIFFGGYVAIMLGVARFRPVPFVASFTGYFIGLYLMEALYLKRLFSERSR
jgi:hypothetical protein